MTTGGIDDQILHQTWRPTNAELGQHRRRVEVVGLAVDHPLSRLQDAAGDDGDGPASRRELLEGTRVGPAEGVVDDRA
jgi:hypothetical protein